MKFAKTWIAMFAPSLVLVAAALGLGVYLLEWLSREVNAQLPDDMTIMVLTAVCNGLMLSLVVIAQSRMTPKDEPAMPLSEHVRLMAMLLNHRTEKPMRTAHLNRAQDLEERLQRLHPHLPEAIEDLHERRANDSPAEATIESLTRHVEQLEALVLQNAR